MTVNTLVTTWWVSVNQYLMTSFRIPTLLRASLQETSSCHVVLNSLEETSALCFRITCLTSSSQMRSLRPIICAKLRLFKSPLRNMQSKQSASEVRCACAWLGRLNRWTAFLFRARLTHDEEAGNLRKNVQ